MRFDFWTITPCPLNFVEEIALREDYRELSVLWIDVLNILITGVYDEYLDAAF